MFIHQSQVFLVVAQTGICRFMFTPMTHGLFADKQEATHRGLVAILLLTR